ncbi:MAG: GTPase Era [Gammaproteobacteria bacterium RIFCSPHIGHO2_12_FULL_42_13]|nr:MAG: GTPase Era [Gammaproteobacteria bacterium RIFCSPHIGHO2_12_FULL_42_13]
MSLPEKCGYIAIIGRPNVGKSTLLNALLGQKISITSPKPQTTRWQVLGIKTKEHIQAVFIDTPGLHNTEKHAINRYMNKLASAYIHDADVILFMIEALRWTEEDAMVLERLKDVNAPLFLVINKVDKVKDKSALLPFINKLQTLCNFAQIIPISANKGNNLTVLENKIMECLPEGPHLYPKDEITDKNVRFLIAEIIREKLIYATEQEIPYSSTVTIENFQPGEKRTEISAIIWVEREGQKAIIVGAKGEKLKQIGTRARKEIEALLKDKVYLSLWVKVKERWTDDDRALKSLGYE